MTEIRKIGQFKYGVRSATTLTEMSELLVNAITAGWLAVNNDSGAQDPLRLLIDSLSALIDKQTNAPDTPKQALALTLRKLADRIDQEEQYRELLGFGVDYASEGDMLIVFVVLGSDKITAPLKIGFPVYLDEGGE
jgi:hypothetical protein